MTNTDESGKGQVLEQRAREVFEASVDALDGQTRARLNRARQAATAELDRHRGHLVHWRPWVPAGALAAAALVAVLLWRGPVAGPGAEPPQARTQQGQTEVVGADGFGSLVAADEDLDIVTDDLDFYEWLDDQSATPGNGVG